MEAAHTYRVVAWWSSGKTGIARCQSATSAIHFTAPPELGGMEGRWTAEDLLLCAVASCYTTVFRGLAEHSNFEYSDLEVSVEGSVSNIDPGCVFSEIVIRPILRISGDEEQETALRLLHKTKSVCLAWRALSVQHRFEPRVQMRESQIDPSHALTG